MPTEEAPSKLQTGSQKLKHEQPEQLLPRPFTRYPNRNRPTDVGVIKYHLRTLNF